MARICRCIYCGQKFRTEESLKEHMIKMRNNDSSDDWMSDFELPQTNEWQKKITLLYTTAVNELKK